MRTRFLSVIVLMLGIFTAVIGTVGVAASMGGCASTGDPVVDNRINYREARELRATLVNEWAAILEADAKRSVHRIPDATRERIVTARLTSKRLLNQWGDSIAAGEPFDGWASVRSVLSEIAQAVTTYEMQEGDN